MRLLEHMQTHNPISRLRLIHYSNVVSVVHVNVVSEEKSLQSTGGCDSLLYAPEFPKTSHSGFLFPEVVYPF